MQSINKIIEMKDKIATMIEKVEDVDIKKNISIILINVLLVPVYSNYTSLYVFAIIIQLIVFIGTEACSNIIIEIAQGLIKWIKTEFIPELKKRLQRYISVEEKQEEPTSDEEDDEK